MSISLASIQKSLNVSPPRLLIYGVQGIGKTEFCSNAPNPVFVLTEDGLGKNGVDAFPLSKNLEDVMNCFSSLAVEQHNFKTLVLDSLDWLEPFVQAKVCETQKVKTIENIPYGKGFVMAMDFWREYIAAINYLRDEKGMMIIQTAHSEIKRFESPESDSYDRYQIKLHKSAAALIQEHSDCVLFANYRTSITEEDLGFKQTRTRAVGSGNRVLYTQEMPTHSAKNRYSLPPQIEVKDPNWQDVWGVLANNIPWFKQFSIPVPTPEQTKNIATAIKGD